MPPKSCQHGLIRIGLPYGSKEEFFQRELELLGRSGTVLRSVESPAGSIVEFELVLTNGTPVLRGEGRILGHVKRQNGDRAAVIRFTRLKRSSYELVAHATRLLAAHRAGEAHFEGTVPSVPPIDAPEALSEENWKAAHRTVPLLRDRLLPTEREPSRSEATNEPAKEGAHPMPTPLQKAVQEKSIDDNRSNALYLVAGSKGGVGKSIVTMALVDLLREQGKEVFLVECDSSNPDVWKAHKAEIRSELVTLDDAEGWIRLLNICDLNRDHVVVVNTAARNNDAVTRFGSTLNDSLDELGRPLVTFWVINRQRDSLELLKEFTAAIPRSIVHVVRNGYFGEERKFELYNSSPTRTIIESMGGKSINFADLADRVADDLYSKHLSIAAATRTLPLGNRAELSRWRAAVKKEFATVLNGAAPGAPRRVGEDRDASRQMPETSARLD